MAVPRNLRRNPQAEHVRKWAAYRARKGKPKALLSSGSESSLTYARYKLLTEYYMEQMFTDALKKLMAAKKRLPLLAKLLDKSTDPTRREKINQRLTELKLRREYPLSFEEQGYEIAKEIIRDFGKTTGLKVFNFGAGYGPLLFFLKYFVGAKTKGADLGYFSRQFTKSKRLGVKHGINIADPSLKSFGKFDVTYSINVFESDVIDRKTALGMLDNLAYLTKKGGRSYHCIFGKRFLPVSEMGGEIRKEIEARGFAIDKWEEIGPKKEYFLIKLTKIKD